jgi:hypothetical protein
MPSDFLLPAFCLTLVVNAVLIVAAIRTLAGERRRDAEGVPPVPAQRTPPTDAPAEPPPPTTPAAPPPPSSPPPAPSVAVATAAKRVRPAGPSRQRRATTDAATTNPGRGRRRRFSLPPLDDDHDRVNRSIETFLAGGVASATVLGEPAEEADAAPRVPEAAAD